MKSGILETKIPAKIYLTAFFAYLAAALICFAPALPHLSDSLIGPPEDNRFILWSLWYGASALGRGGAGFMHTHHIFYPEGISLYFCNFYYYGVALALFLKPFLTMPLIYNLLVLHTFVLAGLGAFFLVYYLTRDFAASFLGGFIFAFNPSHWAHSLHHLTIASIQFVPFFVLFTVKSARAGKRSDIFWASCFMILDALCDWNYLVFDLIFLAAGLGYLFFVNRKKILTILKRVLPVPAIAAAALSPLIVPMIYTGIKHPFLGQLPGHDIYVADVLGFVVPDPYHLFCGASAWIRRVNDAMTGNDWEKTVYLGLANIVLILSALKFTARECRKYFWGLFLFMVLAMGVRIHAMGHLLPVPLPYRILQELPFFTQARNPSRIIVYAYLFLAVLAAFSVKHLSSRVRPAAGKVLILAIFFLIAADFYPLGLAMTPTALPPCYAVIQKDPDKDFGILELPWDGARYMMYQTSHGIPCVQGYMGRRIEKTLLDRLSFNLRDLSVQKKMLADNRVKYVVLFKRRQSPDPSAENERRYRLIMDRVSKIYARTYELIYEDGDCAAYRVYPGPA